MSMRTFKYIYIIVSVVVCTVLALASCSPVEDGLAYAGDNTSCPEPTVAYEGKWTVGDVQSASGTAWLSTRQLLLDDVPYADIIRQLMPNSDITSAKKTYDGDNVLKCVASQTSDNSTLLSIMPATWHVAAIVDGESHSIDIFMTQTINGRDDQSWGTVSKTGVLTLILHVTSYSVDGGEAVPAALKLVFTAKRQK